MSNYTIIIWAVVVLVTFIIAWRGGYIAKLSAYIQATRDELKKCAWPTWDELKGSTLVVAISIALLGGLTVGLDTIFRLVMQTII
jgi:preprotein translocase subunit SecE